MGAPMTPPITLMSFATPSARGPVSLSYQSRLDLYFNLSADRGSSSGQYMCTCRYLFLSRLLLLLLLRMSHVRGIGCGHKAPSKKSQHGAIGDAVEQVGSAHVSGTGYATHGPARTTLQYGNDASDGAKEVGREGLEREHPCCVGSRCSCHPAVPLLVLRCPAPRPPGSVQRSFPFSALALPLASNYPRYHPRRVSRPFSNTLSPSGCSPATYHFPFHHFPHSASLRYVALSRSLLIESSCDRVMLEVTSDRTMKSPPRTCTGLERPSCCARLRWASLLMAGSL